MNEYSEEYEYLDDVDLDQMEFIQRLGDQYRKDIISDKDFYEGGVLYNG